MHCFVFFCLFFLRKPCIVYLKCTAMQLKQILLITVWKIKQISVFPKMFLLWFSLRFTVIANNNAGTIPNAVNSTTFSVLYVHHCASFTIHIGCPAIFPRLSGICPTQTQTYPIIFKLNDLSSVPVCKASCSWPPEHWGSSWWSLTFFQSCELFWKT